MNTEKITEEIQAVQDNIREIKSTWGNTIMTLDNIKSGLKADVQKKVDDAYKRGYEDGKDSVVNGCDGCRYKSKQESGRHPCFACARYYKDDYYEPIQKDEITVGVHFGDEIVVNGERGVIVSHENEGSDTIWALLNGYRTPQIVHKNNYTKTGRRFDMAGIMEAVKNG